MLFERALLHNNIINIHTQIQRTIQMSRVHERELMNRKRTDLGRGTQPRPHVAIKAHCTRVTGLSVPKLNRNPHERHYTTFEPRARGSEARQKGKSQVAACLSLEKKGHRERAFPKM